MPTDHTPYDLAFSYFPVTSDIAATFEESAPNDAKAQSLTSQLVQLEQQLSGLEGELRGRIVSPMELQTQLVKLGHLADTVYVLFFPLLAGLTATYTPEAGERALRDSLQGQSADMVQGFVIYDRYFQVIRIPGLTRWHFATQALETCSLVLGDLPLALLGVDETVAILAAFAELFRLLTGQPQSQNKQALKLSPSSEEQQAKSLWIKAWESLDRSPESQNAWTHKVATFRWIIGHHFFDLCSMACRERLLRAGEAAASGQSSEAAAAVKSATTFLRGTTAAMWYAGNFPASTYCKDVRGQMIKEESPHGFSGEQNADYERMKNTKDLFRKILYENFGEHISTWKNEKDPQGLLQDAYIDFCEIDIEDNEQHTLIAVFKVGRYPSLVGETTYKENIHKFGEELAANTSAPTASGILREMTQHKIAILDKFLYR